MTSRREGHVNDLLKQLCVQHLPDCAPDSAEVSRAYQRFCRQIDVKSAGNLDEHKSSPQVSEEIRKALVSKKGYNVASSFTDAYDRLVQLVSHTCIKFGVD
eukprot:sb/3478477/